MMEGAGGSKILYDVVKVHVVAWAWGKFYYFYILLNVKKVAGNIMAHEYVFRGLEGTVVVVMKHGEQSRGDNRQGR